MQEKEKTILSDFEDLGPDTDFAELEAQEKELNDGPEKPDAEVSDIGQKKSAKKKSAQKDEGEVPEVLKSAPTNNADAESEEEMKELFVALPPDCTADSFTISINLKSYEIKYGEPNMVPKHVYDYYQTMQKQKANRAKVQRALQG